MAAMVDLLGGKDEMSRLIREKDWTNTVLGNITSWSQTLKITLNTLLASRFPMSLMWGEDLIQFYNDAYKIMLGKDGKHPDILGLPAREAWPEIWPQVEPQILQIMNGGNATWDEDRMLSIYRNGKMENSYWTFSYSPVTDESGKIGGVLVTTFETTDKVLSLKKVNESEKNFRLLADSMPHFVWIADTSGDIYYFNQSFFSYSGLSSSQAANGGWVQMVHPDDRAENLRKWEESLRTGSDFIIEHRCRRFDGEYRWLVCRAVPKRNEEGEIEMWVGTSTDIHDRKVFTDELERQVKQRTIELNKLNEALIKSNSELIDFAYVASHDLQEPLRKIQTFATRIIDSEKDNLSDKGRDYFNRMQSASRRMQQFIVDLLSYSRANTVDKYFETTDLNNLIKLVLEQLTETIEQKNALIKISDLPSLHIIPYQFEQLFTNLISNGIKFSRPGVIPEITITAGLSEQPDPENPEVGTVTYHHIQVKDNGIGFEQKYNERIFQVFQRLHGNLEYSGTGIGLAIVKKIVGNHKGFVRAEGTPGEGATFHVYLPAE